MGRASDISRQLGSDVAAQNQIAGQLSSTALQGQNQLNVENARLQNQLEADASSGLMEGRMAQADYYRSMAEANRANTRRAVPPSELIPQPVLTGFDDTDTAALEAHNARANMADATFNAVLVASKKLGVDPLEYLQKKIEELGNFSITDPQTGAVSEELRREKENRLRAYTDAMTALIRNGFFIGSQTSRFAEGGLVTPPPEPSMIQSYQQYIEMARKMGLPPIGFEQYAQLQAQAQPMQAQNQPAAPELQPNAQSSMGIMGFAEGGVIPEIGPQVDGKVVIDPDPNAPTDSIPAIIDGQHPAALDSGEMVIPKDVVMYYGVQKLQQMISKARQDMSKGAGVQ